MGGVQDSWGFKLGVGREKGPGRLMQAQGGQGTWGSQGEPWVPVRGGEHRCLQPQFPLIVKWEDAPPALAFSPVGPSKEH